MTAFNEAAYVEAVDTWMERVLKVNPFEGDRGGADDRVLSDKIVGARKVHFPGCCCCLQGIAKHEAHRALVAVFDGQLRAYRWCQECCIAMVMADADAAHYWTLRVSLGHPVPPQSITLE